MKVLAVSFALVGAWMVRIVWAGKALMRSGLPRWMSYILLMWFCAMGAYFLVDFAVNDRVVSAIHCSTVALFIWMIVSVIRDKPDGE